MNSVFKIKKSAGVNLKSGKTTSGLFGNVSKFNFFASNRSREEQIMRQALTNEHRGICHNSNLMRMNLFYKHSRFNFSEKPEKKDDKPEEEKPPKGFEKFYRKTKSGEDKKVEEKEAKENKDSKEQKENKDHKDSDKESKKKEDEEEKEEEEEKNDEKDKKDKEKEEKESFNQLVKDYMRENYPYMIGAAAILAYLLFSLSNKKRVREVTVNEFNTFVEQHQIKSIEITKDKVSSTFFNVISLLKDESIIKLNIINHEQFLKGLENKQYEMGVPEKDFIPIKLTSTPSLYAAEDNPTLPAFALGFLAVLIFKMYKNFSQLISQTKNNIKGKGGSKTKSDKPGGLGGFKGLNDMFDYGKSNVKEFGTEIKVNVKFKQVAGMEQPKKEVMEFVDFLKHPEKYNRLGAKIPRGALLVGPPGTGKTMLAKAVAGEAAVPFFAISGSDFVEMFVGVGAARVRDLFKKAKEKSPSIIFIDEIDAVGRKRGGKFTGGHDERDNTLNQLLVEMDGFGTEINVIVLAATNRADILDNALLRPGRFDRQIEINLPDRKDREQIFKIYLKKVKLDTSKSVEEYALRLSTLTPGFSGADISNLVNEAAIISARHNKDFVDSESFESAADRIIAGLETRRLLSEKERRIVAYHESGHAVVGWFLEHSSPLVKLTIIPRSKGALGFTQFVPDDVTLRSTEHLEDLICGCLGGRMAEEHFFGSITTGASDDLKKVTSIANAMVTKYGMSSLGLTSYGEASEEGFAVAKPYSPNTESLIDTETNKIINEMATKTRELVKSHAHHIENLAKELLVKETLDLLDIIRILGERPFPLSDNMKDYMKEIESRKKDREEKERKEKEKKDEDNEKDKDNDKDKEKDKDKEDEYEKGKDKDESGSRPAPRNQQERDIQDAETILKDK